MVTFGGNGAGEEAQRLRGRAGRVLISGPDADSVRRAKEKMEFSEARIAITAAQVSMHRETTDVDGV